jgi:hypothetical protein
MRNVAVTAVCGKIEAEISSLPVEDAKMFLEDLGLHESGLARIIQESYSLLGLFSFYTAGEPEVRAWTIPRSTTAQQAAGAIHTDIEKGFIKAEVVSFPDMVELGSFPAAKSKGVLRLEGKEQVRIVCMDLAAVYRSIVKRHFPKAVIVADRFHVIRLVNYHFLACWREIDPVGSKNRGLVSLMRRHRHNLKPEQQLRLSAYLAERPALDPIYRFKQRLCYLLLKKHKTKRQCQKLIPRFLRAVYELRHSKLAQLVTLGDTLHCWSEEIARMWRFTRSNGITEGFHNKMETISRQAYGFRNFENYRQRVQVLCS